MSTLLDRPYAERRRIVVGTPDPSAGWPGLARRAAGTVAQPPSVITVARAAQVAIDAARTATAPAQALPVARDDLDGVVFPPGHPREGVVYAGNPVDPPLYYPAGSFHRLVWEHKLAEAVRLLMALGASELFVEHVAGFSRDVAARIHLPIPQRGVMVDGAGTGSEHRSSSLLFRASFEPVADPGVPDDLRWYPHEPAWREVARGRLDHGMRAFAFLVTYDDDFGLTAQVAAAATKGGAGLGGEWQEHERTEWRMSGTFGPA